MSTDLHHGDAEDTERSVNAVANYPERALTEQVIGLAVGVHQELGPGPLESACEECLAFELQEVGIAHERQVPLPVRHKPVRLNCGYRPDVVVAGRPFVETNSVERIVPIHAAQMLTNLRLSGRKVGLPMNFNTVALKDGLRRYVL